MDSKIRRADYRHRAGWQCTHLKCAAVKTGVSGRELTNNEPVTIVDNIFESNGTVVRLASYGLGIFRNNHIIGTGDDYWIYCPYHPTFQQDIDLSGNWRGTTDTDLIDEKIYDCHDNDHSYHCVLYEPMADGPVPVEQMSWSAVKGLFSGGSVLIFRPARLPGKF